MLSRLLLILIALFFAACSPPPGDGKIHITYWEKWTGAEGEAMQRTVDAFNRSQDRIVVEYLSVSSVDRKTVVATAGGDPPDVAGLWAYNIYTFADNAALIPLDEFIRAEGMTTAEWLARYYPVYADLCEYRGQVWALPSTPATGALHWNKTLFREAGLDPERPPRTVAELDAFAEKLTKRDPKTGRLTQLGFLPQEPPWWPYAYPIWFGGSLFEDGEVTLGTDPRNVEGFQWVRGYTERHGLDAVQSFTSGFGTFASPQNAFFSGKIAMVFQGVWLNNYIGQYAPGLDYGVAPWPAAAGGAPFTLAEADVLCIPRGSRHPKEAWEFIKYINTMNPHAQTFEELGGMERVCYLQEKISPLRQWSPFFTEQHPHPHIALFRQLAESPRAWHIPKMGIWQEYTREINTLFDRVRLLEVAPAEGLRQTHERMAKSWAAHRASTERRAGTRSAN